VGSSQILDALYRYFRGRLLIDVVPNFKMTRMCADRDQLQYATFPVRKAEALLSALRVGSVPRRSVIALCSPRNPFGDCYPVDQVRQAVEEFDARMIVDEAYIEFSGSQGILPLVADEPRLIVVRTFSKAWGLASLRIGYCAGQQVRENFRKFFLLPYNIGKLSQEVACRVLRKPEGVLRSIADMQAARRRFLTALAQLPRVHVWRSETNYVCVELNRPAEIRDVLASHGILVTVLREIPYFPPGWSDGLRIAVPEPAIQEEIMAVLRAYVTHDSSPLTKGACDV
jgi:histidinol-phosphate aminotransferase